MVDEMTSVLGKRKAEDEDLPLSIDKGVGMSLKKSKTGESIGESHAATLEGGKESTSQTVEAVSRGEPLHECDHDTGDETDHAAGSSLSDDEIYGGDEDDFDEDDLDEGSLNEDEEEEPEYEVEEHEHTVPGMPERLVKLRLHISREEPFESWLDNIHLSCTHNGKDIGHALGRYIYRERIRANFWRDMEAPCQDMSNLALMIFNRYGYLKRNLEEHCVQKGTGVWGSELNFGPLFIIERIHVTDREWRRIGVGRVMVNALIQKAESQMKPRPSEPEVEIFAGFLFGGIQDPETYRKLHTLTLPSWLRSDVEADAEGKSKRKQQQINDQAFDIAVEFFRSLGFRRVGASDCFGFSSDTEHKSHVLAAVDDFDPPAEAIEEATSDDDEQIRLNPFMKKEILEEGRLNRLKQTLPLHHATVTLSDADCVEFYKTFEPRDGTKWRAIDTSHKTVLHVAACELKPQSVRWLTDNVNSGKELSSARTLKGYTPLEALQDQLETKRTQLGYNLMIIDISARFCGFSTEAIECLSVLSYGLASESIPNIDRLKLTYGCTCGECLEGFLSPRMKLALTFQAETIPDMLEMDVSDGPTWCKWNEERISHVPADLQRSFRTNKSLRQGFANLFTYIAACLGSNVVPNRGNVLEEFQDNSTEWPPCTRNYLTRGGSSEGKIEAALTIIFEGAVAQDERTGDGEFDITMKDEVAKLKKCRNDYEFGFVAGLVIGGSTILECLEN